MWKSLGVPGAFHDREGPLQRGRHPLDQLASVTPIGPDQLHARELCGQPCEHVLGPIAVLDSRRMHHHHQKETKHIHDDVALAPPRALPPVIAADPPFSVVFTVWLSMIPALGARFLP
jgi:hypothetical protein